MNALSADTQRLIDALLVARRPSEAELARRARILSGAPDDAEICPECDGAGAFCTGHVHDPSGREYACDCCSGKGWVA